MTDRYSKFVLTVIAAALVYLCVVMTAFPAVNAQGTRKAGEMITPPIEAVIVGWKLTEPLQIATTRPLPVQTERSDRRTGRSCVVIVGWERGRDVLLDRTTADRRTSAPAAEALAGCRVRKPSQLNWRKWPAAQPIDDTNRR